MRSDHGSRRRAATSRRRVRVPGLTSRARASPGQPRRPLAYRGARVSALERSRGAEIAAELREQLAQIGWQLGAELERPGAHRVCKLETRGMQRLAWKRTQ